ncbi:hypothetical protein ACYCFK_09095 [Stutzerimonas stutzeri]|jgi:hypothetical protein
MLTRDEADGAAEVMLAAYCRACGCATPEDVRKACEMMISKSARAIEKYNDTGTAVEVLQRTARHVARAQPAEVANVH